MTKENANHDDHFSSLTKERYTGNIYPFKNYHPKLKFSHLFVSKLEVIPKTSPPEEQLCLIEHLELSDKNPDMTVKQYCDDYVKMAWRMLNPFLRSRWFKVVGELLNKIQAAPRSPFKWIFIHFLAKRL